MTNWVDVNDYPPTLDADVLVKAGSLRAVASLDYITRDGVLVWQPSNVHATYEGCGGVALDFNPTHWAILSE